MSPFSARRRPHHVRGGPRGHALIEALIAMTVLLLCSTMIAHTTLTAIRLNDTWQWRTAALDSLDHRSTGHWISRCAGWSFAPAEGNLTSTGRLVIHEEPHPTLAAAGLRLEARWSGMSAAGVQAHALRMSSGHWCGQ